MILQININILKEIFEKYKVFLCEPLLQHL